MAGIASIRGNTTLPVDPEIVELLEELLDEAKAGRLTALAGFAEYHDDSSEYLHVGTAYWKAVAGHLIHHAHNLAIEDDDEEDDT